MSNRPNLSANDIANYILYRLCVDKNCQLTTLQLQKLLYYVQGYSLGILGKPAFFEDVEAWDNGPVVPNVYENFKEFGGIYDEIPCNEISKIKFATDDDTSWIIDEVIRNYADVDGSELSDLTHNEAPWIFARDTNKRSPTIKHQHLREYFKKHELVIRYENHPKPRNRYSMVDLMKLPTDERNAIIRDAQKESAIYIKEHEIDPVSELNEPYWDDIDDQ